MTPASSATRPWLFGCGIAAPVLYVAMMQGVGLFWSDYSAASQMVSELSAIGAPTRPLWSVLGAIYTALMLTFAWAVWTAAPPNRPLRVLGALLIVHAVFGAYWPPMHQRAVLAAGGGTLTDSLHLLWAAGTGVLVVLEAGFGAAAFGKRFRVFTVATLVIVLGCGAMTGTYTSRIQANLPTPGAGVWERINIGAYMGWIAAVAVVLLRQHRGVASSSAFKTPATAAGRSVA